MEKFTLAKKLQNVAGFWNELCLLYSKQLVTMGAVKNEPNPQKPAQ